MSEPLIRHTREFLADTLTPLAVYRSLRQGVRGSFLFESVTGGEQVSRYSLLGAAPSARARLWLDRLEVEVDGERTVVTDDPLGALSELVSPRTSQSSGGETLPFTGGWVGFFGYDLARLNERLGERPPDPFGLPVASLARYDDVLVFDHARQRIVAVVNESPGHESFAAVRLDRLAEKVRRGAATGAPALEMDSLDAAPTLEPSLSDEEYGVAVERAKEYIGRGDIFQVVLARRFQVDREVEPVALYRALRVVNPSPYMVLLESPEATVVGASPEMLVRREAGILETRPIAGTRPRGRDEEEDRALAQELLADPKERAEHVMLVDLGRNDLGRVARPGRVRVATFMDIERYSHVMHIVSSVRAEQRPEGQALDALLACFPAGTLSGAPKIRAMEIIDELEPEARGIYGGAVGYLSFSGDMDTCIAIRTLVMSAGQTSITAGAGIVADSDPAREAQETRDKAAALLHAVTLAEQLAEEEVR